MTYGIVFRGFNHLMRFFCEQNWKMLNNLFRLDTDNKKFKQGHFEMGIRYANFMPISNRCARRRAALCPLTKCYQESAVVKPSDE
ncbi:hypothetical protein IG604_17320 [Vibrio cholerae]|nr:hypothetical protein [Vibrio cholerae]